MATQRTKLSEKAFYFVLGATVTALITSIAQPFGADVYRWAKQTFWADPELQIAEQSVPNLENGFDTYRIVPNEKRPYSPTEPSSNHSRGLKSQMNKPFGKSKGLATTSSDYY